MTRLKLVLLRLAITLTALFIPAATMAEPGDVQTAWRLLDYIAVDYGGAVAEGRVKSAAEYAEMNEFSASVTTRLRDLPAKPERPALVQGADNLQGMIARKASASLI